MPRVDFLASLLVAALVARTVQAAYQTPALGYWKSYPAVPLDNGVADSALVQLDADHVLAWGGVTQGLGANNEYLAPGDRAFLLASGAISWSTQPLSGQVTARGGHGSWRLANGDILFLGGYTLNLTAEAALLSFQRWIFEPVILHPANSANATAWTFSNVTFTSAAQPSPRAWFALQQMPTALASDTLLLFGGCCDNADGVSPFGDVWLLDLCSFAWTLQNTSGSSTGASGGAANPGARSGMASMVHDKCVNCCELLVIAHSVFVLHLSLLCCAPLNATRAVIC